MDADSRAKIFARYTTTTYAARNNLSAAGIDRMARGYERDFGRYLPADPTAPILEIGCGSGAFLLCCARLGHTDACGIDVSGEQVELCRRNGVERVECAEAREYLEACPDRFALVMMSDVLEHVPKPEVVPTLEAVRHRLAPGGRLVVRVPNLSNPLNMRTRYVDFTHESGFTVESLSQVLRTAGLGIERVYGAFAPHRRLLARWLFDRLGWSLFRLFVRHTLHLKHELSRGKNLVAIATAPAPVPGADRSSP